jgi:hypothetical protein
VTVGTKYHPAMARKGGALILASAVLTLGACSGSDGDATPATTVTPATVAPTTAAPTTTSAPTTTQAPTTTIDPAETVAAEVEADLLEAYQLANQALQDPGDEQKEMAALDRRTGFARDDLEQKLADYRASNRAIRPNPLTEASMTVEVPAVLVLAGGDVAEVQTCEVDPWIVVEVGAGPDGSDAIVEPSLYSYRSTVLLRLVDGVWRIEGGTEIASWEGSTECPVS